MGAGVPNNMLPGVPTVWFGAPWMAPSISYQRIREACHSVARHLLKEEKERRIWEEAGTTPNVDNEEVRSLYSETSAFHFDVERCEVGYFPDFNFDNIVASFLLANGKPLDEYGTTYHETGFSSGGNGSLHVHNKWRFTSPNDVVAFADYHRKHGVTDVRPYGSVFEQTQLLSKEAVRNLRQLSKLVEDRLADKHPVSVKASPWKQAGAPCWPVSKSDEYNSGTLNICRECETYLPANVSECYCCGSRTPVAASSEA